MASNHSCLLCGKAVSAARWDIGRRVCMKCGEANSHAERKTWTIVPMHKSNLVRITDLSDLHGINNKGGLVK